MAKLPVLSWREVCRALEKAGFRFTWQRGSHMVFRKGELTVVVPKHREIARGTLLSILKEASLSKDQFLRLVR